MKYLYIILVVTLFAPHAKAQDWLAGSNGNFASEALDVAVDGNGNSVVIGYFAGTMQMGATTLNSNGGSRDIFTAKLTANGGVTWARSDGGNDEEIPYGIAVDGNSNVIITGKFTGNTTIGSTSYSSQINPANGAFSTDIFIAKFTTAGAPTWTKKGNSKADDMGIAVTCDNANNIYVTGQ